MYNFTTDLQHGLVDLSVGREQPLGVRDGSHHHDGVAFDLVAELLVRLSDQIGHVRLLNPHVQDLPTPSLAATDTLRGHDDAHHLLLQEFGGVLQGESASELHCSGNGHTDSLALDLDREVGDFAAGSVVELHFSEKQLGVEHIGQQLEGHDFRSLRRTSSLDETKRLILALLKTKKKKFSTYVGQVHDLRSSLGELETLHLGLGHEVVCHQSRLVLPRLILQQAPQLGSLHQRLLDGVALLNKVGTGLSGCRLTRDLGNNF